jgi:hypothetical protein
MNGKALKVLKVFSRLFLIFLFVLIYLAVIFISKPFIEKLMENLLNMN